VAVYFTALIKQEANLAQAENDMVNDTATSYQEYLAKKRVTRYSDNISKLVKKIFSALGYSADYDGYPNPNDGITSAERYELDYFEKRIEKLPTMGALLELTDGTWS